MQQLVKGTQEYRAAQNFASQIEKIAGYTRRNNNHYFNLYLDPFETFLDKVIEKGGFAAQVAQTIASRMSNYGYCVANVSSKQAWILACAAVQNELTID